MEKLPKSPGVVAAYSEKLLRRQADEKHTKQIDNTGLCEGGRFMHQVSITVRKIGVESKSEYRMKYRKRIRWISSDREAVDTDPRALCLLYETNGGTKKEEEVIEELCFVVYVTFETVIWNISGAAVKQYRANIETLNDCCLNVPSRCPFKSLV